jgi:hypothetical protein
MARAMTPAEKQRFRGYFPGLDVNRAVVSGEMSPIYNCILWTVRVTNRWIWPGNTLAQFDTGSSRSRVGKFHSSGSMQVRIFSRKYSSSR